MGDRPRMSVLWWPTAYGGHLLLVAELVCGDHEGLKWGRDAWRINIGLSKEA
jgi:hypothetical protein